MTTSRARAGSRARTGTGEWALTAELDAFEERAGELLRSEPTLNTVALTVTARMRVSGWAADGARFGVWAGPGGRADGYFFWTPPHFLYVGLPGPEEGGAQAAGALLDALAGLPVDGVNGTEEATAALADAWRSRHPGGRAERRMRQRLFRLGDLTPPDPLPEGRPRIAGASDRALLADWHLDFEADAHTSDPETRARAEAWADDRIGYGGVTLWEDAAGTPVSMAGVSRRSAGTVRVAPVYTPPPLRGRGYAGAVTAEVSRVELAAGVEEVLLFTDRANATSNALYQRLGYRPVRDFAVWEFMV
ncbi:MULTISPECIES: GNAT family N-acetyltransferase [unclassified Streptomyces]|uniref:GNAT family N-acetyltransferase n=1 Tax=unclassified Streptomyces TaxID=2593676 RepID=UPI00278C5E02|nr:MULTISPECIES: GNAT family N-acetyltransferase [unclassified Streptomyces]